MAFTDAPDVFLAPSAMSTNTAAAVPVALGLDTTGVRFRMPVIDTLNVLEFGIRAVGATATGTALIYKLQGEPVAGGSAVDLSTCTNNVTVTQGKCSRRLCDVEVDKATYSFVVLNITVAGAAGSTGIPYIKARVGGSGGADTNDVNFTA